MSFSKQRFGLHYSMPLDEVDFSNLRLAKTNLLMLPLSIAARRIPMCKKLTDMGQKLILRMDQMDGANKIAEAVNAIKAVCPVESLIVYGNEPDMGNDLSWSSPDWGNQRGGPAETHAGVVDNLRRWIEGYHVGVKLIAPALSAVVKTETDVSPGLYSWRELLAPAYNKFGEIGAHIYLDHWGNLVNEIRLQHLLSMWCSIWHLPILIDELGFLGADPHPLTEMDRMNGYIYVADKILANPVWASRVSAVVPFVSNGNGVGWDARYILRDPAVYRRLGQWVTN